MSVLTPAKIEQEVIGELKSFIHSSIGHRFPTRAWISTSQNIVSIYVRSYSIRFGEERGRGRWFDLASISIQPEYQGLGIFKNVLTALEHTLADQGFTGLRIENVQTERFAHFFNKRPGYECCGDFLDSVVGCRAPWTFVRIFSK